MLILYTLFYYASTWSIITHYTTDTLHNYTASTLIYNSQPYLLIFGGYLNSTLSNTLIIINLNNSTITKSTPLNISPRRGSCSTTINTLFYVFGGIDQSNTSNA